MFCGSQSVPLTSVNKHLEANMLLKIYILDQFVFLLFSLPGVDVMATPKSLANRRDSAVCAHPETAEVNGHLPSK